MGAHPAGAQPLGEGLRRGAATKRNAPAALFIAVATTLVLLAGCGGSQAVASRPISPTTTGSANTATAATVTLQVAIPTARTTSTSTRRSQYVAVGTQSISVALLQGSTTVLTVDQNLTSACSPGGGGLVCTITFTAPAAGSYTANIITYALTGETGTQLSASYGYSMPIVSGTNNVFNVTLYGIAASFLIASSDAHVISAGSGYWVLGSSPYTFTIYALDGLGNEIVGSGAPTLTITSADTSVFSVSSVSGYPNEFNVQAVGSSASAVNLNMSAAAVAGAPSGAPGATALTSSAPLTPVPITTVATGTMQGWALYDDCSPHNGTETLVGTPTLLGSGSLQLSLDSGSTGSTECITLNTPAYDGTLLSNLALLQYSSYQPAGANAIFFTFDVCYVTGSCPSYQGRLTFEPAAGGDVGADWQHWNTLAGVWWASNTTSGGSNGLCPISSPCTWSQVLADWPTASIRSGDAIYFKAGSGWSVPSGFTGNVDDFTIGVTGGSNTAYAF